VILFGKETDTQDSTGKVLRTGDTEGLNEEAVRQAVQYFVGGYEQLPPMYSALKVNGKKLYELAREGKTIERRPRRVEIYEIQILSIELPRARMRVCCSKGTYIRTLCHDIGKRLGCGACMEKLTRTRAGSFSVEDSLTVGEIEERKEKGSLTSVLIPIDRMFDGYEQIIVRKEREALAYNGGVLPEGGVIREGTLDDQEKVRVYDEKKDFIGIYKYEKERKEFAVIKMFYHGRQ